MHVHSGSRNFWYWDEPEDKGAQRHPSLNGLHYNNALDYRTPNPNPHPNPNPSPLAR